MKLPLALSASLLAGVGLLAQLATIHAQTAIPAPNSHVLDLDGKDSYVELPADAFTNLYEVTVEGWVKWASFLSSSRFFDFTLAGYEVNIQNRFETLMLRMESFRGDDLASIVVSDFLPADRWIHIAVTAGNKGSRMGASAWCQAPPGNLPRLQRHALVCYPDGSDSIRRHHLGLPG